MHSNAFILIVFAALNYRSRLAPDGAAKAAAATPAAELIEDEFLVLKSF